VNGPRIAPLCQIRRQSALAWESDTSRMGTLTGFRTIARRRSPKRAGPVPASTSVHHQRPDNANRMPDVTVVGGVCWASLRSPQPTWAFGLSVALFHGSAASNTRPSTLVIESLVDWGEQAMPNVYVVGKVCWASLRSPQPTWAFGLSATLFHGSAASNTRPSTLVIESLVGWGERSDAQHARCRRRGHRFAHSNLPVKTQRALLRRSALCTTT
jgi:hypothetical protein